MNDQHTADLILTPGELAATIEALHDAVLRRIGWAINPTPWRELDLSIAQEVINSLVSSYTRAMMVYRESDFVKLAEFEVEFRFSPEVFDILNAFTLATSWDQVPMHSYDGCDLCLKLPRMP